MVGLDSWQECYNVSNTQILVAPRKNTVDSAILRYECGGTAERVVRTEPHSGHFNARHYVDLIQVVPRGHLKLTNQFWIRSRSASSAEAVSKTFSRSGFIITTVFRKTNASYIFVS